jgi:hypothetical protein
MQGRLPVLRHCDYQLEPLHAPQVLTKDADKTDREDVMLLAFEP